jgi:hypothetical protein
VYDFEGGKFRHLFQPSISSIRKGIDFLQTGSPLNVKAVHILNAPYFMDIIFCEFINFSNLAITLMFASFFLLKAMVKPFARKEILSLIHLHPTGMNFEDFFNKHIPKSHMPKDYGGDLETVKELHEKNHKRLYEMREYFLSEEKQVNYEFEDRVVENNNNNNDDDDFYDADE